MHAGAGADVDDIVGGPDRVLVVLDHDHRIAQAPQAPQRVEKPRVVALMQPDRRLVEHIEHAGQARADLRGEADALALAARERARSPRQRQIVEPDITQEREAVDDLLQDAVGDLVALGVELRRQALGPVDRGADREQAHLADVLAVDLDRQRLGLEAKAMTGLAGRRGHVALDLLARPLAFGLAVAAVEIGDHALERLLHLVGAQAVVIAEADLFRARAVQDHPSRLSRQFAPRAVETEPIVPRQRLERLHVIGRTRLGPGRDRALAQREPRVGDDEGVVDPEFRAQAAADRTGAERIVEREQPGLDLGDGEARDRTGELRREQDPPRLTFPPPLSLGERGRG